MLQNIISISILLLFFYKNNKDKQIINNLKEQIENVENVEKVNNIKIYDLEKIINKINCENNTFNNKFNNLEKIIETQKEELKKINNSIEINELWLIPNIVKKSDTKRSLSSDSGLFIQSDDEHF